MGGALSCIIADLFLEDYEEKIDFVINETHINDDWFRYRDDTWLIWEHSLQDLEAFKDYLNSLHSKIKWTYEVEKNGVLNFLDILLKSETGGSFTTTVYRKKTHSDRYLHFLSMSNHPLKDKISGIKTSNIGLRFIAVAKTYILLRSTIYSQSSCKMGILKF